MFFIAKLYNRIIYTNLLPRVNSTFMSFGKKPSNPSESLPCWHKPLENN